MSMSGYRRAGGEQGAQLSSVDQYDAGFKVEQIISQAPRFEIPSKSAGKAERRQSRASLDQPPYRERLWEMLDQASPSDEKILFELVFVFSSILKAMGFKDSAKFEFALSQLAKEAASGRQLDLNAFASRVLGDFDQSAKAPVRAAPIGAQADGADTYSGAQWPADKQKGERAVEFLQRVWGQAIEDGMPRSELNQKDERLYRALVSYMQNCKKHGKEPDMPSHLIDWYEKRVHKHRLAIDELMKRYPCTSPTDAFSKGLPRNEAQRLYAAVKRRDKTQN
ncbi:MAG: hypothetical protein N4A65_04790 [Cohaesibacter sp.]|nr:hypothetical protein [Cohaesibacter sp.]